MSHIQILPEVVANQIAAGEVIERPANVLKELLENSLDAQATRIDVVFRSGGSTFIQVSDNGVGMNEADAELCFKRHATSKLRHIHDLQQLHSFGFRGEALPSIASVSRVTLMTRTAQSDVGVKMELQGGVCTQKSSCACPVGTTFMVEQLFYNVPVRRKFLKSQTTESAHLTHCVRLYALAYPNVHFTLKQDQHLVFSSPQCTSLEERVVELWPKRSQKAWISLDFTHDTFSITGLMSPPGEGSMTTQDMATFLNKRPINNTFLWPLLKDCYHGYIPLKTYPSAFLFITMPEAEVDINVHPTKREVRFKHEQHVKQYISEAIRTRLAEVQAQPLGIDHKGSELPSYSVSALPASSGARPQSSSFATFTPLENGFKEDAILWASDLIPSTASQTSSDVTEPLPPLPTPKAPPASPRPPLNFFALWQNRYAFFTESVFLIMLDCAGAQKRLWYERICSQLKKEQVGVLQTLLFPHTFDLDALQATCLQESIDYLRLRKICTIQALTDHQFQLQAIPQWLPLDELDLFIQQLVEGLIQWGQNRPLEQLFEPLLQQLLKKFSFTEVTSQAQVENLYQELQAYSTYLTDPSGHRIWSRWTAEDLLGR